MRKHKCVVMNPNEPLIRLGACVVLDFEWANKSATKQRACLCDEKKNTAAKVD